MSSSPDTHAVKVLGMLKISRKPVFQNNRQPGSNQSGNKSPEIKQSSSIYAPFSSGMWKEAEETFCAGHGSAEKRIHVDIFQWNKISWVCKFHSYHISTRPGGCKSADLIFQHSGRPGRTWRLALQSNRDILRITSRTHDNNPWRRGYTAPCLLFHFSQCLP